MGCAHERIKSVNCVLFCDICGEKLPADFLTGKNSPARKEAPEPAQNAQETTSKEAPTATRKRTTKKGAK